MRLKHYLTDSQVIGFLDGNPKCERQLTEWILENCRICLEDCISERYKDVAQEISIAILNCRDNPKMQARPGSYATTINRHKIIDVLRGESRAKETLAHDEDLFDNRVSSNSDPLERMIKKEETRNRKRLLKTVLDIIFMSDDSSMSDTLKNGRIALTYQLRDVFGSIDNLEKDLRNRVSEFIRKYEEMERGFSRGTIKSWVSRYRVYLRVELNKHGWGSLELKTLGF